MSEFNAFPFSQCTQDKTLSLMSEERITLSVNGRLARAYILGNINEKTRSSIHQNDSSM